jgi:hypothetical protein
VIRMGFLCRAVDVEALVVRVTDARDGTGEPGFGAEFVRLPSSVKADMVRLLAHCEEHAQLTERPPHEAGGAARAELAETARAGRHEPIHAPAFGKRPPELDVRGQEARVLVRCLGGDASVIRGDLSNRGFVEGGGDLP